MDKLSALILIAVFAGSGLSVAQPTRKCDDKGDPPFNVRKECQSPPLVSYDNLVIGLKDVPAPGCKVEGAPEGKAQQFVLFDATFTFTKEDADNSKPSKSHYYVRGKMLNADRPKDWTNPIDYRNGTVHIRAEVIDKPEGGAPTTWTLCYIPNKGLKAGYGCTGTQVYKEKGVYERDVKMTEFWQNDCIDWEKGIKEMHLVMKDDSGGAGHAHKRKDSEKFFPTKMRITMIQVAKGAKYDPKLVPNLPNKK